MMRAVEADGGTALLLQKGDKERGSLLLVLLEKGMHAGCFERQMTRDGRYDWARTGPENDAENDSIAGFLARKRSADPDLWIVELAVADGERFAAETLSIS